MRRGAARSETSKSETWVPRVRPVVVRGLADADQRGVVDRVEVAREPGDLQRAAHRRPRRVGQVERVERVGLAEGHDVAAGAQEPHGEDALAPAEAVDLAHPLEPPAALGEHGDEALALPRRPVRGAPPVRLLGARRAQVAVVLGERELVQQEAAHRTAGTVGRARRVRRVELVDEGRAPRRRRVVGERRIGPARRGDVHRGGRRVDDLAVGEDRVGVEQGQGPRRVDRQHGDHAQSGEGPGPADRPAADGDAPRAPHRQARQPRPGSRAQGPLPAQLDRAGRRRDDRPDGPAGAARRDQVAVDRHARERARVRGI